jgi:hypothetical protein
MTPDDKPPSREELAEDVAARMRAAGLDATSDGENVTVIEPRKKAAVDGEGASTGKNIATVLGVTLGGAAIALVASLIWFGLVFSVLGGAGAGAGERAGEVGFTIAALMGGAGALMTGWDRKTPAGNRDVAALIVGLVLGLPLLLITARSLGMAMDALTKGYGKAGIIALFVFFGGFAWIGDRLFKRR